MNLSKLSHVYLVGVFLAFLALGLEYKQYILYRTILHDKNKYFLVHGILSPFRHT